MITPARDPRTWPPHVTSSIQLNSRSWVNCTHLWGFSESATSRSAKEPRCHYVTYTWLLSFTLSIPLDQPSLVVGWPFYISSVLDQIDFLEKEPGLSIQRLKCNSAPWILYPKQIAYGSGRLPKVIDIQAKSTKSQKKSLKLVSSYTVRFHRQIVRVLQTLSANIDNKRRDKPANLEKAMSKHDWPK